MFDWGEVELSVSEAKGQGKVSDGWKRKGQNKRKKDKRLVNVGLRVLLLCRNIELMIPGCKRASNVNRREVVLFLAFARSRQLYEKE